MGSRRSGSRTSSSISREEAGDYIKTYFQRFPGIRDYMDATKKAAHAHGFVETIFGRRMHFPEINTKNPSMRGFLERAAINAPIQGSAADIIRRAMIRMPRRIERAKLASARMLLQVHDELVFEVADAEADYADHSRTSGHGNRRRARTQAFSSDPRRRQSRRELGRSALS